MSASPIRAGEHRREVCDQCSAHGPPAQGGLLNRPFSPGLLFEISGLCHYLFICLCQADNQIILWDPQLLAKMALGCCKTGMLCNVFEIVIKALLSPTLT